jgi:hypothetical protein|tara:strand:- start:835 stop:1041 length:207 start_codon:yes stop_codon:yes gene_type:complete
MHKIVDGKKIEMTSSEILARQEEEKQNIARQEELKTIDENKKIKKASGKQKLKDLGLDDDEIKALIGA